MEKLVNKYTGLVCPYRTPANVKPEIGKISTEKDPTVQSDYEPLSALVDRVQRGDLSLLHTQFDMGYEYDDIDDVDTNADDVEDYIDPDCDILDRQIDVDNYLQGLTEAQQAQARDSVGSTKQANENDADEARNDAEKAKFEEEQ